MRKPKLSVRWAAELRPRLAARRTPASLPQEPPRTMRWLQSPAVQAEPSIIALTAGGQDLVPGDLAIGVLERDESAWRLRDPVEPWPASVTVSVFTFGPELQRLILR